MPVQPARIALEKDPKHSKSSFPLADSTVKSANETTDQTAPIESIYGSAGANTLDYSPDTALSPADVLRLQRLHGNQAVVRMLDQRRAVESHTDDVVIQRHSSFEHRLLGDARPSDLGTVANQIDPKMRTHILTEERKRLQIWQKNPQSVSAAQVQSTWP